MDCVRRSRRGNRTVYYVSVNRRLPDKYVLLNDNYYYDDNDNNDNNDNNEYEYDTSTRRSADMQPLYHRFV